MKCWNCLEDGYQKIIENGGHEQAKKKNSYKPDLCGIECRLQTEGDEERQGFCGQVVFV